VLARLITHIAGGLSEVPNQSIGEGFIGGFGLRKQFSVSHLIVLVSGAA
jgi:hypothetical protein